MANRTLGDPDPLDEYDRRMKAKQAQQGDDSDQEQVYRGAGERLPSGPLIRNAKGEPLGDVDQQGQAGYQATQQAGEQTGAGEPFRKAGQWAKGQDKTTWRDKDERGPPAE